MVFAQDPMSPVGCKVEPPWIGFVLAHPMDAQSDWDLEKLKAKLTPLCHVPQASPEQFLGCGRAHCARIFA